MTSSAKDSLKRFSQPGNGSCGSAPTSVATFPANSGQVCPCASFRRVVEIELSNSAGMKQPRVLSTSKQGAERAAELKAKAVDRPKR